MFIPSFMSSIWSSTRPSESDQTAGWAKESLEDAPTSKLGFWAEKMLFEDSGTMLQKPVSFKFAETFRSSFSLANRVPFGFIILLIINHVNSQEQADDKCFSTCSFNSC